MNKNLFEEKLKPLLGYIGLIGAVIMSITYIIAAIVLIKGFKYTPGAQALVFAIVNTVVGLIIANFLKYQGISFAKNLSENKAVSDSYYGTKTKDKKTHSLTYFWVTSLLKDIFIKGTSFVITTFGLIYLVIVGSNDWNMLFLAIVNLLMFICFGLLALNKAYDYYNNTFVPYMKEKINERGEENGK